MGKWLFSVPNQEKNFFSVQLSYLMVQNYWDFKNSSTFAFRVKTYRGVFGSRYSSKICGRQRLKNLKWYGFPRQIWLIKAAFYKFCLVHSWIPWPIYDLVVKSLWWSFFAKMVNYVLKKIIISVWNSPKYTFEIGHWNWDSREHKFVKSLIRGRWLTHSLTRVYLESWSFSIPYVRLLLIKTCFCGSI